MARSDKPLRIHYYPQRLRHGARRDRLSPGQALHLVSDPERAALAQRTRLQCEWPGAAGSGRFRAALKRLLRR